MKKLVKTLCLITVTSTCANVDLPAQRELRPVVFYLQNLPGERIGTLGDAAIINSLEEQDLLVIPVDCGSYPRSAPELEEELIKFHEQAPVLLSQYYSPREMKALEIYYVPEGFMLKRQIPVWNIIEHGADGSLERIMDTYNNEIVEKHKVAPVNHPDEMVDKYGNPIDYNLYLNITYPSGTPDKTVPLVLLFSASSNKQGSISPTRETQPLRYRNIFPLGFLTSGYAFAIADHCYNPLAHEHVYGYFERYSLDDWNGKASTTAYIRYLNQHADAYNLNGKFGVMGISKAAFSAVRIADKLNAEGSEHSLFDGTVNTKPQPWGGFPSTVDVAYAAAGNGTRRIPEYVNRNTVPMVTSAGLTDKYGHWGVYPRVVKHFKDLDQIHLAFWMEDLGHDYPCFGTDLATGLSRYRLTKEFFEHYLKPPTACDPLKVFYVLPKEKAPRVDSRGRSRVLAADDILPENMNGLAACEPITVRFLSRVDAARIRESVKVYGTNPERKVDGVWTSSMEATTFHFEPLNDLVEDETYRIVISPDLENELGQVLPAKFVREFTVTESAADSGS